MYICNRDDVGELTVNCIYLGHRHRRANHGLKSCHGLTSCLTSCRSVIEPARAQPLSAYDVSPNISVLVVDASIDLSEIGHVVETVKAEQGLWAGWSEPRFISIAH